MITVLLVEDQTTYRQALATVMLVEGDLEVVGEVERAQEAVIVAAERQPNVAIVDLDLTEGSGVEAIVGIRRQAPETACLVVTGLTDDAEFGRAIEAGASAVLHKWINIHELLDVLRTVAAGATVLPQDETAQRLQALASARERSWQVRVLQDQLTAREWEVLRCLVEGASNHSLARQLTISPQTAQTHVRNLLAKLGVGSRLEAVVKAVRLGLVDPPH